MRRGEVKEAELLDELVAAADGAGDPDYIVSARLARAEAHWLPNNLELARSEVEVADDVVAGCDAGVRGAVAVWLRRLGSTSGPRRDRRALPLRGRR